MVTRFQVLEKELRGSAQRWLVSGAAGFVGYHVARRLLELGQYVVALDDLSTGKAENIEALHEIAGESAGVLEFHHGDIRNRSVCDRASERVRYVSHQAAIHSVPQSLREPERIHEVNVSGTVNLLLAARANGVDGFVYASCSSVYGDHLALPKRESEVGLPLSPFALSKRVCEQYAQNYGQCFDLFSIGLRYFTIIGPGPSMPGSYAGVITQWLDAMCEGRAPVIFGDGQSTRDYCPVDNVVQANLLAATAAPASRGRVYNIALGQQVSLIDLFTRVQKIMESKGMPCVHLQPTFSEFRPGDVRHSRADIRLAQELLGYRPAVDLDQGLHAIVEARLRSNKEEQLGVA